MEETISILEKANINYFLIRPISENANDVDVYMNFDDLYRLTSYLRSQKVNAKIISPYKFNTIFLLINKTVIDIHTPVIAFSHYRNILFPFLPKEVNYFIFRRKKIPIASEPYLFFYWLFHYIFDKKSFSRGTTHKVFIEKYQKSFKEIIEDRKNFSFLTYLFRDKAYEVLQLLKNNLFSVPEVLTNQQIEYLNRIVKQKRIPTQKILTLKIKRKIKGVKIIDVSEFNWQEEFFQTYP